MTESKHNRLPTMMGRTIDDGRYRVDALIGEGGMGQIYVGRQTSVNRQVALKFLHGSLSDNAGLLARFEREAKSISRLRHPNIISLIDHGRTEDDRLFMVMELLGGESLAARLNRVGPLPVGTVLHIVCQVVSALVEAHASGIIHRDLKPDNIHLDEVAQDTDFVKVLDFGIAKIVEGPNTLPPQTALTIAGSIFGTPQYMSPEQVTGKPVDHRSDLYSMGMIIFEMLTGKAPFNGPSPSAILVKQATDAIPDLLSIDPDLDPRLASLVEACTQKKVENRIPSAVDLLEQLRAIALDFPNPAVPVPRPALGTRDTEEILGCAPTIFPDEGHTFEEDSTTATAAKDGPVTAGSRRKILGGLGIVVLLAAALTWPEPGPDIIQGPDAQAPATAQKAAARAPVTAVDAAVPTTAWLRFETQPSGASVFLEEEKVGVTPLEWRPLVTQKPVTIRFEHPEYQTVTRQFELSAAADLPAEFKIQLPARPAPVPKVSKPAHTRPTPKKAKAKAKAKVKKPAKKRRYQKL